MSEAPSKSQELLRAQIRSHYKLFEEQPVRAPNVCEHGRFIGVDNRQQRQYDLPAIRGKISEAVNLPLVQVVGDSGTPFHINKLPAAQALLSTHAANCLIEYGFTASMHDTNWLVKEYLYMNPHAPSVANIVQESASALDSGFEGSENVSKFLILFDRLSPTRFGDDMWLSDGIMSKELGDKMLCFEGGPQALYQCTNALIKGINVVAVTHLRSDRYSAARILTAFKDDSTYRGLHDFTEKQTNVTQWCLSILGESGEDIPSLIIPMKLS